MELVFSTPIHVQHDNVELFRPNKTKMRAMTTFCSNFYSFSMYFDVKSMKTELLVEVLKLFLKLLLWCIFLEILKWKLVSELLSVIRDM
jgi:hypothetical protein